MNLTFARSLVILTIATTTLATAEDWPAWRGPRGDGSSLETNLPASWDGTTGDKVVWKRELPGTGHGSPVVYGDRIFLVSCVEQEKARRLFCFSTKAGDLLWQSTIFVAPLEIKHSLNSFASSTPAVDQEQVFAAFLEIDGREAPAINVGTARNMNPGQIVVAAYGLDGKQQWVARPGLFSSVHGFCSNPVVHGDRVIINGDHDGDSYLVALDRHSGETLWKAPRRYKTRSYATPIIRKVGERDQLVLPGSKAVTSFDPRDGSTIWSVEGPTEQFVASPVYNGTHFFVAAGFPTHHVVAIRPDGKNDVTDSHVDWHQTEVRSYVPSPILAGDYLLVADDRGTANCFDAGTGQRYWNVRLGRKFSASPINVAGKVYMLAEDGVMHIVRPDKDFDEIAQCPLGERAFASPAVAGGRLYIRGEQHLYAIGDQ